MITEGNVNKVNLMQASEKETPLHYATHRQVSTLTVFTLVIPKCSCMLETPGKLFFFFFNLFIYLFLAVLGLRFCARAFSSCGKRGPLFIAVRGPLTIVASLVAEHRLQTRRLSRCGSRA